MASMRAERVSTPMSQTKSPKETASITHPTTNSHATRAPTTNLRSGDIEEVEVSLQDGVDSTGKPRMKKQRVRIGRNGKPLPPRKPRNAPTEDDIARDALVERLLSENRYDKAYAEPQSSRDMSRPGHNEDADAQMAEEFRREFLANAAENRAKRQAGPPVAKGAEVVKGPKMGGSRNQRAIAANQEKAKAAK